MSAPLRRWSRWPALLAAYLLLILLVPNVPAQFSGPALTAKDGVNYPNNITTDQAVLFPADRDIILQPGDAIRITLYGVPEYQTPDRVATDGTVSLPLIGVVHIAGLARHDAEALIAHRLEDAGMFRNPQVILDVTETPTQSATVIGEVHGIVPVLGRRRLYDAIALAGGFTPVTSHVVSIHRPGVLDPIVVDLGTNAAQSQMSNVPIFAGDTIETSRVGSVYMLGAFRAQQAIPLGGNSPLTLLQAMTLVGGIPFDGKNDQMKIIRTIGTRRSVVEVDMKKISAGKAPDPVLQTDDIVLLPTSTWRAILRNGALGTAIGLAATLRGLYY